MQLQKAVPICHIQYAHQQQMAKIQLHTTIPHLKLEFMSILQILILIKYIYAHYLSHTIQI